jgi:cation transport regulator ChaC
MAGTTTWYFAYGSNMKRSQLESRAGAVHETRLASLPGYELAFNRKARGGVATANIRPAAGKLLRGVLYRINESAFRSLDRFEGAPQHYRRIQVDATDASGAKIPAQVYIATRVEKGLKPAAHYLQAILDGAREHGLPADYIESIRAAAEAG